jgi:maltooligosyltrehalose trehalohydrolase
VIGAIVLGDERCRFRVWAPGRTVEVHILSPTGEAGTGAERVVALEPLDRGYHEGVIDGVSPGALYRYRLDGGVERPDPASRAQPQGVHGPSQVVDERAFPWTDEGWTGLPLESYACYELHVGTFTPDGTLEAAIDRLDDLVRLGVTAVEPMPVAPFPGDRNWGYDGVYPFAVHSAYGGPAGLRRFVDACHRRGLAVVLDVVYNHLGPEGNYLGAFGPYFTERYLTPWGAAINFDDAWSDEVRGFFIENALHWITAFHIDALRLDAVHAIVDQSARPFLQELAEAVHARGTRLGRRVHVIAESNLNDPRLLRQPERGGYGLDAQWSDDFHHSLHALLTGERAGYYRDFGTLRDLEKAFREGFVLSGGYSVYRRRRHGAPSVDIPATRLVVCAQNHDQVGNRPHGERLTRLVSFEALKLAAGTLLLAPFVPLLFMGEEYGETAPFLYFTSHTDPDLAEAVRRGRREEHAARAAAEEGEGREEIPDPQGEETFRRSRLDWALRREGRHRTLLALYTELLRLRKAVPALASLSKDTMEVHGREAERVLVLRRWTVDGAGDHGTGSTNDVSGASDRDTDRACDGGTGSTKHAPSVSGPGSDSEIVAVFNFSDRRASVRALAAPGRWAACLDSADERWEGPGRTVPAEVHSDGEIALTVAPTAFTLLVREDAVP